MTNDGVTMSINIAWDARCDVIMGEMTEIIARVTSKWVKALLGMPIVVSQWLIALLGIAIVNMEK